MFHNVFCNEPTEAFAVREQGMVGTYHALNNVWDESADVHCISCNPLPLNWEARRFVCTICFHTGILGENFVTDAREPVFVEGIARRNEIPEDMPNVKVSPVGIPDPTGPPKKSPQRNQEKND